MFASNNLPDGEEKLCGALEIRITGLCIQKNYFVRSSIEDARIKLSQKEKLRSKWTKDEEFFFVQIRNTKNSFMISVNTDQALKDPRGYILSADQNQIFLCNQISPWMRWSNLGFKFIQPYQVNSLSKGKNIQRNSFTCENSASFQAPTRWSICLSHKNIPNDFLYPGMDLRVEALRGQVDALLSKWGHRSIGSMKTLPSFPGIDLWELQTPTMLRP